MTLTYPNSECVRANPSPFMDDILDGHSNIGDDPCQLCNTTWPVTDHHIESDQPSICSKTSVQTPAKQGGVYIASTQGKDNSKLDTF